MAFILLEPGLPRKLCTKHCLLSCNLSVVEPSSCSVLWHLLMHHAILKVVPNHFWTALLGKRVMQGVP